MRTVLLAIVAVATALVLPSCGGGGEPRPDLVFVSTRDGDYAIFEMNADGSRQKRLTDTSPDTSSPSGLFFQIEPAWSHDAAQIAFASKRAGTFDLYVMRADGGGTRRLTATSADDRHPTWSPDGKLLAFARDGAIDVVGAGGGPAHAISPGSGSDSDPAWSPNGKWIAFARRPEGTQEREIWVMQPDGSHARRLTSLHGTCINPSWSPDGSRIAFASDIVRSLYDLYLVGVGDKRVRRLTRTGPDTFEPAWSPDRSTIAFTQDGAISTTDLRGRIETLTSTENNDSSAAWNPGSPPAS